GKSDNASDVSRRHTRSNNCVGLFSSACPNTTNSNCALEISLPFEGDDASLRYNRRQPGSDSSVIATPLNPRWRAVLIIHLNDCCLLFRRPAPSPLHRRDHLKCSIFPVIHTVILLVLNHGLDPVRLFRGPPASPAMPDRCWHPGSETSLKRSPR